VRASTPDVARYVEAYRRRGFAPVRRAVTLAWDLTAAPGLPVRAARIEIGDGLRHPPEVLAELHCEGMLPYWDWYIEERGGPKGHKERVAAHFDSIPAGGANEMWLTAEVGGFPVGLAYVADLDQHEADLGGVYVLPAHRGQGFGSALLRATLDGTRRRTTRLVVPETMTALDGDIPSIRLHERSGGRVRAEYVHLEADGEAFAQRAS
jgi:ribosomal protein S18 acetylase RimI-like enzyme